MIVDNNVNNALKLALINGSMLPSSTEHYQFLHEETILVSFGV
jgi:hypothetical protein